MKAAFFHDHRFGRDAAGAYYSNGALSYRVFSRYLRHFDELVVVGREQVVDASTRTLASGAGIAMACVAGTPSELYLGSVLRRHVRSVLERVDCAIARLPSLVGRVACREAMRAGKPCLVEVVGCAWDALWSHGSLAAKALAAPSFLATRRCVAQAPFAVYVSRESLQRRYPCGGRTIACSNVAIERPARAVLEARLARITAQPRADAPVIGLVGSLDVDYKGHETAVCALALLRQARPGLRLRLLGSGDFARWRARAARLGVGGQLELSGTVPHGAPVLEWMDRLDVLVAPSLAEGLPRALIEAMSRALPAVGSRVGGIPELLPPEWTHAAGDARGLAVRLERLLADRAQQRAQALRNWHVAGEYASDVLEDRRHRFLAEFHAFVRESGRSAIACTS